jgi:hypothetical protein
MNKPQQHILKRWLCGFAFFCFFLPYSLFAGMEPPLPVGAPIPSLSPHESTVFLKSFQSQRLKEGYKSQIELKGDKNTTWKCDIKAHPAVHGTQIELHFQDPKHTSADKKVILLQEKHAQALVWLPLGKPSPLFYKPEKNPQDAIEEAVKNGDAQRIPIKDWLVPLVPHLTVSVFDFLMPFLFWEGSYLQSEKLKGRTVHRFKLNAPTEFLEALPEVDHAEIIIDSGFKVLMQVDLIGKDKKQKQTLKAQSFKKTNHHWILKSAQHIAHAQRKKTSLSVLNYAPMAAPKTL